MRIFPRLPLHVLMYGINPCAIHCRTVCSESPLMICEQFFDGQHFKWLTLNITNMWLWISFVHNDCFFKQEYKEKQVNKLSLGTLL